MLEKIINNPLIAISIIAGVIAFFGIGIFLAYFPQRRLRDQHVLIRCLISLCSTAFIILSISCVITFLNQYFFSKPMGFEHKAIAVGIGLAICFSTTVFGAFSARQEEVSMAEEKSYA
ncbi:hypothetical protein GOV04_02135 [Candidatus Woesearchaeota archaeon]|nr:hypothetical protein [Candidatus Woesearchaeota archaeon]